MKIPIAFPSLICGIIISQHTVILNSSDSSSKRESPLSIHYRLFEGTHAPNIVLTYGKEYSNLTFKANLIVELKDICKALDVTIETCTEKKIRLERLIKYLDEEGPDDHVTDDVEEGDKEEEDATVGDNSKDDTNAHADI